jgi:hypothetical protein
MIPNTTRQTTGLKYKHLLTTDSDTSLFNLRNFGDNMNVLERQRGIG